MFERKVAVVAMLLLGAAAGCGSDSPSTVGPGSDATSLDDLLGNQLYRADGSQVGVGTLAQTSVIGIYFARTDCGACAAFTPVLVEAYHELKAAGKSFEVILVTSGITNSSMFQYMEDSGMEWLAVLPQSSKAGRLVQYYQVQFVPTLVIINGNAKTLSLRGREEVTESGASAYDAWLAASGG